MKLSSRALTMVFGVISWAACTGGGSTDTVTEGDGGRAPPADAAATPDDRAVPQAILDGRFELGSGNSCPDVGPLFPVGAFGDGENVAGSTAIKDGETFGEGTVSIACSVVPAGADRFDMAASVALTGANGGLFRIDGKLTATGEQVGVHAIFSLRKSGSVYEQTDRACIVRYTSSFMGVAAGRVWGEVTCPKAENAGAQTACQVVARFRFENCTQ